MSIDRLPASIKPLNHRQRRALALRQRGLQQNEVAEILKTTDRTISRWETSEAWIRERDILVEQCVERSRTLFREHAEAVSQATVNTAIEGNTPAQRTCLEIAGVLEANPTSAHGGDLARALAAVQVNVRVERGKGEVDEVITIESQQAGTLPVVVDNTISE